MLKFKKEEYFKLFMKKYDNLSSLTYLDIANFAEENNLDYGVAYFDRDKDTLHIKVNDGECFIASSGEPENCKGKYAKLLSNEDYEAINKELNNDLDYIFNGNLDVICVNKPFIRGNYEEA